MEDSERIQKLQAQVASLQQKLHDLHSTDVSTLRRGYATVSQHVDALKLEAARLEELVEELEPELYPPQYIADEIGKAAAVSGAVYGLFRLVKTITPLPAKASNWLKKGLFAVTAIVISWRFATSSIGRFAASLLDHKRRRRALLRELSALQQRIDILHALTSTMPGVQTTSTIPARQQQQQHEHLLPSQLALPAAPVAEPLVGTAAHAGPPLEQPPQGVSPGGAPEHFVVVDLPRVHSGGFMNLTSPVRSPAPGEAAAAAAAAAGVPAWAEHQQQQQQQPSHIQLQQAGTAAALQQQPVADAGIVPLLLQTARQQSQQQQQQHPELLLMASRSSSSLGSATAGPSSAAPGTSAFTAPSSVLGWGSLGVQQQPQPDQAPWQQHTQQPPDALGLATGVLPAGAIVTDTGRAASGDTDADEGEWVEQPGMTSADDTGSSSNGHEAAAANASVASATIGGGHAQQQQQHSATSGAVNLQRSSPTESTSSDDVVVL